MNYRNLTGAEIERLQQQKCIAEDWTRVQVAEGFDPQYVRSVEFYGDIRLGRFEKEFAFVCGIRRHSGLHRAVLSNVTVGDNSLIENVSNYIANYDIGEDTLLVNVGTMYCEDGATFGNGVEVSVLNETGGREVMIYDHLSAQTAYVMALYRHRPGMIARLRQSILDYTASVTSNRGRIGSHCRITDTKYVRNLRLGDYCKLEGCSRLNDGSVNGNADAPSVVGNGVIADHFIIQSGSKVRDNVILSKCFVGQACELEQSYSATESVFFSNSFGANGEACALFAGPYTVTHHKSTLLIAGMFSFMNAGSGSNQSNHMYKLGPLHQGIMERGAKTASDSYVLWPAKVGAFSLVMGRHTGHQNTSNLPFSYLIEEQNTTYIMPGANLKSVGTIRDARKWPSRDGRKDPVKFDCVNYNLLSPYTIQKMLNGLALLRNLQKVSGYTSDLYSFQSGKIRRSSLEKGLVYYGQAIDKFLGNSLISRIQKSEFKDIASLRAALKPSTGIGRGDWVDAGGLIAPKSLVDGLLDDLEQGRITHIDALNDRFHSIHDAYYEYEWTWAYGVLEDYYGVDLQKIDAAGLLALIDRWKKSVITMDEAYYADASKEFDLNAMTGFGADGDEATRREDFLQVRGASFEKNPFVVSIRDHIREKTALYEEVTGRLKSL